MKREPYQIALVGESGRGKTYSLRNLDPDTTGFINIENKPLPFKNNFKHYCRPNSWSEAYAKLIEYGKNDDIKTVVLESFSAGVDSILKVARDTKRGHDIWNYHNDEVGKMLYLLKKFPKDIIVTAHPRWIETPEGATEKRIGIKGKEWNTNGVEKDFTIVLFADVKISDDNKREYFFNLNSDGTNTAKTPPVVFEGQETVPNDMNEVLVEIDKVLDN